MTTLNFGLKFCSYKYLFSKNCYNDDYCHPLAPVTQSCSYLKGQIILETLVLKICIIPPENVLKGVIQDIWNVYSHPNPVSIASYYNLNEMHVHLRSSNQKNLKVKVAMRKISQNWGKSNQFQPIFLEHDGTNIVFSF